MKKLRNGTRLAYRFSKYEKHLTKLWHVSTKTTSKWQSHRCETLKSCEMVQSWHADLVKYENLTSLWRRNRKIFHFTWSYKHNLVKFVKHHLCNAMKRWNVTKWNDMTALAQWNKKSWQGYCVETLNGTYAHAHMRTYAHTHIHTHSWRL